MLPMSMSVAICHEHVSKEWRFKTCKVETGPGKNKKTNIKLALIGTTDICFYIIIFILVKNQYLKLKKVQNTEYVCITGNMLQVRCKQ